MVDDSDRKVKVTTDNVDKHVLSEEVKEGGDACDNDGDLPSTIAEDRLEALHHDTHDKIKNDGVAKADLVCWSSVNGGVPALNAECVLCIPDEPTEEGKDQHG